MSVHAAAQITIGGWISRALVPGLLHALAVQRAALDWGDAPFLPRSAEELLAQRRVIDGEWVIQLCDTEARSGRFDALESYLRKRRIPYDRRTEAGLNGAPQLTAYRPDADHGDFATDGVAVLVPAAPLWDLTEAMAGFRRHLQRGPRNVTREKFDELVAELRRAVPPRPEPLPAFEIGRSLGLRTAA